MQVDLKREEKKDDGFLEPGQVDAQTPVFFLCLPPRALILALLSLRCWRTWLKKPSATMMPRPAVTTAAVIAWGTSLGWSHC